MNVVKNMKLSEIKQVLPNLNALRFQLPDGAFVPVHFHVTEVGVIHKRFIDCGGVMREESIINFQLWEADDYDHRLAPKKLLDIVQLSEQKLNLDDLAIEVEYQQETIGKYSLGFDGNYFQLITLQTDCLAKDQCGVPSKKSTLPLAELGQKETACCSPESNCC